MTTPFQPLGGSSESLYTAQLNLWRRLRELHGIQSLDTATATLADVIAKTNEILFALQGLASRDRKRG